MFNPCQTTEAITKQSATGWWVGGLLRPRDAIQPGVLTAFTTFSRVDRNDLSQTRGLGEKGPREERGRLYEIGAVVGRERVWKRGAWGLKIRAEWGESMDGFGALGGGFVGFGLVVVVRH